VNTLNPVSKKSGAVQGSHPIQWTANTGRPTMEDVGRDHGCLDVAMAQLLDHAVNGVADAAHSCAEPAASSSKREACPCHFPLSLPRVERIGTEAAARQERHTRKPRRCRSPLCCRSGKATGQQYGLRKPRGTTASSRPRSCPPFVSLGNRSTGPIRTEHIPTASFLDFSPHSTYLPP
jgi:hypothetical protein